MVKQIKHLGNWYFNAYERVAEWLPNNCEPLIPQGKNITVTPSVTWLLPLLFTERSFH
jgi:hypothetical protein